MNRPFTSVKRLAGSILAGAAMLSAPAAYADVLTFNAVTNIVSPTLNAGDSIYSGGQEFNDGAFRLTVQDAPLAQLLGVTGLSGAIIDGSDPFNCAVLACPSGNDSKYFGGLNDGALRVTNGNAGQFRMAGLDFAFIAPVGGLEDGIYGMLRVLGIMGDGTEVAMALEFPSQDADGKFMFGHWDFGPEFSALKFTSILIDACVFDDTLTCVNSVDMPAMNLAQFGVDNVDATAVPLPGSAPLLLLGLSTLLLIRRRAQ